VETLTKAEQLKNELDALRPLNAEAEARIMQKFRLDWNYHSNNLEGNSLTYGETKALILFGITAQGKPLKDHFEITGHNEAINWILDVVKDKMSLTETFVRQLNQLLLKEPYYVDAKTADGKLTKRLVTPGKYKTEPNHVLTVTGETFYFATPEEIPAKMQELIEWFRKEKEKPDVNPIILAALFHYRFIRIHPFDDGNGRVARILMNFILMQFGYPPVIIKTEDKENYYAVLRLADAGEIEPFIEYITENLIRSLEIMIRGAKGESIEEPEDLDKEVALLERKIRTTGRETEIYRSREVELEVFDNSIEPLISHFIKTCEKFDRFYTENKFTLFADGDSSHKTKNDAISSVREKIQQSEQGIFEIQLTYNYIAFNQVGYGNFNFTSQIFITFDSRVYRVSSVPDHETLEKSAFLIFQKIYLEQMSQEQIEKIVKLKANQHKRYIEARFEQINNVTK